MIRRAGSPGPPDCSSRRPYAPASRGARRSRRPLRGDFCRSFAPTSCRCAVKLLPLNPVGCGTWTRLSTERDLHAVVGAQDATPGRDDCRPRETGLAARYRAASGHEWALPSRRLGMISPEARRRSHKWPPFHVELSNCPRSAHSTTQHVIRQAVAMAGLIGVPAPVHVRQVEGTDGPQRTARREEFAD